LFHYDESLQAFLFDLKTQQRRATTPILTRDLFGNEDTDILVPLAPCVYRMTDYTLAKKEPILLEHVILKLGVLRCLQRECDTLNHLLQHRIYPQHQQANTTTTTTNGSNGSTPTPEFVKLWNDNDEDNNGSSKPAPTTQESAQRWQGGGSIEEEELGKVRFMELLSNCGIYQKVAELVLQRAQKACDAVAAAQNANANAIINNNNNNNNNPFRIPQVRVDGLDDFLNKVETLYPSLQQARDEIQQTQTVSFYPGLGELFCPGSKLLCYPEGMGAANPLGCSCVQSWYAEDLNKATGKVKRRFVLVVEFIVSVGDEVSSVVCVWVGAGIRACRVCGWVLEARAAILIDRRPGSSEPLQRHHYNN
jgi:hypothetical protein